MKILAISGSLRAASINAAFCRATAQLAPQSLAVEVLSGLAEIAPYNQDLEVQPPPAVAALRARVGASDALIIASPEYAHGVSGVMKNALDRLVSYEGTEHKPVAQVNTSPRAHHAHDALRETLATMSVDIVAGASLTVPLLGTCATTQEMIASPQVRTAIAEMLDALVQHVRGTSIAPANFPVG